MIRENSLAIPHPPSPLPLPSKPDWPIDEVLQLEIGRSPARARSGTEKSFNFY